MAGGNLCVWDATENFPLDEDMRNEEKLLTNGDNISSRFLFGSGAGLILIYVCF